MSAIRVLLVGLLLTAVPLGARAEDRSWGLGLQLDADSPAGGVAALTFRPFVPWARLHGGVTWNYYAFGLQGGLTLAPFRSWARPTATVEAGTTFDADLRSPLSGLHVPEAWKASLSSVGYAYASGLLGLELGNPDGTTFFLRAGVSRAWSTLRGVSGAPAGSGTANSTPIHLAAWVPAASVGVALRFW
ncbi:hypothetical protein [Anaeromyxobacter diazotrophicus]|uniref:hypothetical protein n=1 Tax=Anaeromyxobacter diazotrophicus TaxID=2590199 RepID=UPI0015921411|nr:hypothetical protein [Anaeromyxobacter diazotrophicus]